MTRILLNKTVLQAARERIDWLYGEFPNLIVSSSGGKDSTVVLELAIERARHLGRLPVPVIFLDQEAEWNSTIEYMRAIRQRPELRLHWFQIPFKTNNSSSSSQDGEWLRAWEPGTKWMRDREPDAITEPFRTDRFSEVLKLMPSRIVGDAPCATLTGMRAEESPIRMMATTWKARYRDCTWCAADRPQQSQYTFHPIYDWTWRDVWTGIHEHGWRYNKLYDEMFRKGVPVNKMRVSGLTHEVALASLRHLQEIEPETWDRAVERLPGIHGCGTMAGDWFPTSVPPMFSCWRDYRDHLLANLIEPRHQQQFRSLFEANDRDYRDKGFIGYDATFCRQQAIWVANNDWEGVKAKQFLGQPKIAGFRRYMQGKRGEQWMANNPHIPYA